MDDAPACHAALLPSPPRVKAHLTDPNKATARVFSSGKSASCNMYIHREHYRSSQMARPGECPPCALYLSRRILYSPALRLLKFPRLRHLPQMDTPMKTKGFEPTHALVVRTALSERPH